MSVVIVLGYSDAPLLVGEVYIHFPAETLPQTKVQGFAVVVDVSRFTVWRGACKKK